MQQLKTPWLNSYGDVRFHLDYPKSSMSRVVLDTATTYPENIALWKWFIDISIAEFKKIYSLIGADFESWNGESFYFEKADEIVDMLTIN